MKTQMKNWIRFVVLAMAFSAVSACGPQRPVLSPWLTNNSWPSTNPIFQGPNLAVYDQLAGTYDMTLEKPGQAQPAVLTITKGANSTPTQAHFMWSLASAYTSQPLTGELSGSLVSSYPVTILINTAELAAPTISNTHFMLQAVLVFPSTNHFDPSQSRVYLKDCSISGSQCTNVLSDAWFTSDALNKR